MASKLLNVLNKIENGRQDIIETLNNKQVPISRDSALSHIAGVLNNIDFRDPSPLVVNMDTYYDNPEDDPDVFSIPESYPNIKEIFDEIVTNDIKYSDTYNVVKHMIVFKTTDTATKLQLTNAGTTEDNSIRGFYVYDSNPIPIITSDGSSYLLNSSTNIVTHTWDTSKDIIGPTGEHFKYVITFCGKSKQSAGSIQNCTFGSNIEPIAIVSNIGIIAGYPNASSYGLSNYKAVPYFLMVYDSRSDKPVIPTLSVPSFCGRRIEIRVSPDECVVNKLSNLKYATRYANTLYIEDIENTYIDSSIGRSIVYARTKTFKNFDFENYGLLSNEFGASNLKYLICNTEAQAAQTSIPTTIKPMPRLKNIEPLQFLLKPNSGSAVLMNALNNYEDLSIDLTAVPDGQQITGLDNTNLAITVAETLPSTAPYTLGTKCRKLTINGLKHITRMPTVSASVRELHLPIAEDSTSSILTNANTAVNINYICAPKLHDFTAVPSGTVLFNQVNISKIVLGNNIVGNLDLKVNKALNINCVMDIIDNLKDLTGTNESYTLTLYTQIYYMISAIGYKDIATNKGWTVVSGS